MATFARILDGRVAELFTPPDGSDIADCFHPDVAAQFIPVPDEKPVVDGWTYDGQTFAAPVRSAEVSVPFGVSSAQAKIQCLRTPGSAAGKTLLDDITSAVQATGGEAQIWFTEA